MSFSSFSLAMRRVLFAFGLYLAQNYNLEPAMYFTKRALAGAPVVCSPWTAPQDDDGACMKRQRAIDVVYAVNAE